MDSTPLNVDQSPPACAACEREQAEAAKKALSFSDGQETSSTFKEITIDHEGFVVPAPEPSLAHPKGNSTFKVCLICSLSILFFILGVLVTYGSLWDNDPDIHSICFFPEHGGNILLKDKGAAIKFDRPAKILKLGQYTLFISDTCSSEHSNGLTFSGNNITLGSVKKLQEEKHPDLLAILGLTPMEWMLMYKADIQVKTGHVIGLAFDGKRIDCCVVEINPVIVREKVFNALQLAKEDDTQS